MSFNTKHSVVLTYHYIHHGIQGGCWPETAGQNGVTHRSHTLFKTLSHQVLEKISILCNIVRINRRSAKARATVTAYNEGSCHQSHSHPLLSSSVGTSSVGPSLDSELWPVQTPDLGPHSLWHLTPQETNPHTHGSQQHLASGTCSTHTQG